VGRAVRYLLLTLLVLSLAACGTGSTPSTQNQRVTQSQLKSRAEAHLYYPGSSVVSVEGRDEDYGIDIRHVPAEVVTKLDSSSDLQSIFTWYDQRLKDLGWTLRKVDSVNFHYHLYTRGSREVYEVGDAHDPAIVSGEVNATYAITYSILPFDCVGTSKGPMPLQRASFGNC